MKCPPPLIILWGIPTHPMNYFSKNASPPTVTGSWSPKAVINGIFNFESIAVALIFS